MATQPEDTKTPTASEAAVAPEATAQAARRTTRETAPAAPAAPAPAKAPAKKSGPTAETKRKAARSTTAASRRGRARTGSKATTAAPRRRLVPPPAAAVPALPAPVASPEPGERAGHAFGRLNADIVAASRTAGHTVVDAVEGAGDRIAAYHEQVARTATLPWIADIARANAGIARAATRAYAGTARTLLKD